MFRTRTGCRGLDDPASPAESRDVPVVLGASRSAGLRHELCRTFPPPPRCGTPRGWRWQEILSRAWLRDTKGKSAVSQSGGVTQRAASGSAVSCSCRAMLCSPHSPDLPLDAPFPETPLMRRKRRNGAGGALPRRRQLGDRFQDRRLRPLGHPPTGHGTRAEDRTAERKPGDPGRPEGPWTAPRTPRGSLPSGVRSCVRMFELWQAQTAVTSTWASTPSWRAFRVPKVGCPHDCRDRTRGRAGDELPEGRCAEQCLRRA